MAEKKKLAKGIECPWCEQTNFECGILELDSDALNTCEFRTLPKEKGAIMKRMGELVVVLKKRREELADPKLDGVGQEKAVRDFLDKMSGLEKMVDCLEKEFKVPRKESLRLAGYEGMSMVEKAKALMRLKQLNRDAR